jgi:thioredoxin
MKKIIYLLSTILTLFFMSCNGQTSSGNEEVKKQNTQDVAEKVPDNAEGSPVHINKAQFLDLVMNYEKNTEKWVFEGDKPCLVDFYADWCGPCRISSPILEDLAKQYAGKINIYKVDIDDEQEIAAVFGIQSIPAFLFCPVDGEPTMSAGIANTPAATKQMFIQQIEQLLLKKNQPTTGI